MSNNVSVRVRRNLFLGSFVQMPAFARHKASLHSMALEYRIRGDR